MKAWRTTAAALLSGAAFGVIVRSANANFLGRFAGILAAFAMGLVAYGAYRERSWALGAMFFIAIFWFWAALALRVRGVIGAPEFVVWIAWAGVELVATVRARPE